MTINSEAKQNSLTLDLFPLPTSIDIKSIKSASEYIVINHLTRGLVTLNKEGQIQGEIAKSWLINKNTTEFIFEIKNDQYFSDGELISSSDIVNSINWQLSNKDAIHVDFQIINKVESINNSSLKITLKKPEPRFLIKLTHAEFGILHKSDLKLTRPEFKITSGYYFLNKLEKDQILFTRNPHQKNTNNQFVNVIFKSSPPDQQYHDLIHSKTDFAIPYTGDENNFLEELNQLKRFIKLEPHIGFTYWISFNLKSKVFQSKECRSIVFDQLKEKPFDIPISSGNWQNANQLYLPLGPGRLTKEKEQELTQSKIKKSKCTINDEIRILIPKNYKWENQIITRLKQIIPKLTIAYYSNQQEFVKLNNNLVDLYIMNNDFSSLDLSENLFVTFNETRQLIHSDAQIKELLNKIKTEELDDNLYKLYSEIGEIVLRERYIVPLFYQRINFYHSKKIDLSNWSVLFPEISAWKIKSVD